MKKTIKKKPRLKRQKSFRALTVKRQSKPRKKIKSRPSRSIPKKKRSSKKPKSLITQTVRKPTRRKCKKGDTWHFFKDEKGRFRDPSKTKNKKLHFWFCRCTSRGRLLCKNYGFRIWTRNLVDSYL